MSSELAEATIPASIPARTPTRARRYPLSIVLGAVVAGAVGGFAAAGVRANAARVPVEPAQTPAATPLSLEAWWAKAAALAAQGDAPDAALHDELARALATSPGLLAPLLERYGREPDRHLRGVVRELVVGVGQDVAAAARALAASADHLERAAGFELLASTRPSEASYALARQHVFDERDVDALAGALAALVPVGRPSNAETSRLLPRLLTFASHPDALVRAHAVQRVAEWDVVGAQSARVVGAALRDPDRVVRQAGVGAVMIGSLHDASLKPALLRIAAGSDDELVTRGAALQALERFWLSDDDERAYAAAHAKVEKLAAAR